MHIALLSSWVGLTVVHIPGCQIVANLFKAQVSSCTLLTQSSSPITGKVSRRKYLPRFVWSDNFSFECVIRKLSLS